MNIKELVLDFFVGCGVYALLASFFGIIMLVFILIESINYLLINMPMIGLVVIITFILIPFTIFLGWVFRSRMKFYKTLRKLEAK